MKVKLKDGKTEIGGSQDCYLLVIITVMKCVV